MMTQLLRELKFDVVKVEYKNESYGYIIKYGEVISYYYDQNEEVPYQFFVSYKDRIFSVGGNKEGFRIFPVNEQIPELGILQDILKDEFSKIVKIGKIYDQEKHDAILKRIILSEL